jgi:hypothetical protein
MRRLALAASAEPGWFKANQYVFGANHNFFNDHWNQPFESCDVAHPDGDNGIGNGNDRLSREAQRAYLTRAVRLFLRATLDGDERARGALAGVVPVTGLDEAILWPSYSEGGPELALPDAPETSGFESFGKYFLGGGRDQYKDDSFFHSFLFQGYVGRFETQASFTLPVDSAPAAASHVVLRVAQAVEENNDVSREMHLDLELTDTRGRKVTAPSDWAGTGISPWYARPPWLVPGQNGSDAVPMVKTVLGTVMVPLSCFTGDAAFSIAELASIRVVTREQQGTLAFANFELLSR